MKVSTQELWRLNGGLTKGSEYTGFEKVIQTIQLSYTFYMPSIDDTIEFAQPLTKTLSKEIPNVVIAFKSNSNVSHISIPIENKTRNKLQARNKKKPQ